MTFQIRMINDAFNVCIEAYNTKLLTNDQVVDAYEKYAKIIEILFKTGNAWHRHNEINKNCLKELE